ncbi:MAG: cupin domain-containing protein [Zoogloeaceae bacterium]|nr:cupin domain-containing protein [Rhodocyclaceae bacterium]MCP5234550.1 cupin domain-containing protein [Zoogloeaceae bacterium]
MVTTRGNLFETLPATGAEEAVDRLLWRSGTRIERIVSRGHRSPDGFWYDQPEDEWVCLLAGQATLSFEAREPLALAAGDWLLIPAHVRHRVAATSDPAVWLAVFVDPEAPDRDRP